ncbi:inner membrane protein [Neisseria sp. HSC-16F19]|nr:cell envelope integrity protein CreD [Neisseria sp. HSC-16F19]MCP2039886.1 inner membrane protein [Neisseria sp. HSC-16F19]
MERISIKIIGIALMCMLFWICLLIVNGAVSERERYARQVAEDIAQAHVGSQTLLAPFVMVPVWSVCEEAAEIPAAQAASAPASAAAACTPKLLRHAVLAPFESEWTQDWQVSDEQFKRGIYAVQSYQGSLNLKGRIRPEALALNAGEAADWRNARWLLGLGDRRGLASAPKFTVGGREHELAFTEGIHNRMRWLGAPAVFQTLGTQEFTLNLNLAGTRTFALHPIGDHTRLSMQANWPHPSFGGDSLPVQKNIHAAGFNAVWDNTAAGQENAQRLQACLARPDNERDSCLYGNWYSLDVSFVDTVNNYSLTERSVKYGMLFILLTFGTFFVYEVLRGLRVHPVQYLLVGAALTVFYLLLLSFSEQFGFAWSYLGASAACIALIGWYLRYVLQQASHALGFSLLLAALYGVLFWLLHTDEHTLMIGSVLLFAAIALMMFFTRNVDWYAVSPSPATGALRRRTQPKE